MNYMTIRDEVAFDKFPEADNRVKFCNVYDAFTNRGRLVDKDGKYERFELKDLVTKEDLARFMPITIETVVREAIEPNLFIVDKFFQLFL